LDEVRALRELRGELRDELGNQQHGPERRAGGVDDGGRTALASTLPFHLRSRSAAWRSVGSFFSGPVAWSME
jgi:hypothetical protein